MRTFIIDGPGDPARHYLLPAASRLPEVRSLVDQGAYFVVRAPARTGKTTSLRALAAQMAADGRYAVLVCPGAVAAPAGDDFASVEQALLSAIRISAEQDLPAELRPPPFTESAAGTRIWEALASWASACPRPLVLFFDEFDSIRAAALRSVLRQFEAGFSGRPGRFPWSIALVGQFDIRASAAAESEDPARDASVGPFVFTTPCESLRALLPEEVRAIGSLYTAQAGQSFSLKAIECIHEFSAGHPFFVQALMRSVVEMVPPVETITKPLVLAAARKLVENHVTPVDALAMRLSDPRVKRVIEPLLAGNVEIARASEDDVQFVRDIGLLAPDDPARIGGWIHEAMIPRILAQGIKRAITETPDPFFEPNGRLSLDRFLHGFAVLHSTHGKQLMDSISYRDVAPEMVLFGFLLRILEGRGWVDIDYGNGRGRIELAITTAEQKDVLVVVSRRKGDKGAKTRGLAWIEHAMDANPNASAALVVFDRRGKRALEKRIKLQEASTAMGRNIRLLRA